MIRWKYAFHSCISRFPRIVTDMLTLTSGVDNGHSTHSNLSFNWNTLKQIPFWVLQNIPNNWHLIWENKQKNCSNATNCFVLFRIISQIYATIDTVRNKYSL